MVSFPACFEGFIFDMHKHIRCLTQAYMALGYDKKLDYDDVAILDLIWFIAKSPETKYDVIDNQEYFVLNYLEIFDRLPLLNFVLRRLQYRLSNYVKLGLVTRCPLPLSKNITYYKIAKLEQVYAIAEKYKHQTL